MSLLYVLDRDELPEGESPPDPDLRLAQARGLAESGQLLDAARTAAAIWLGSAEQKPVYETRVLGYLLFGALLEDGMLVLARLVRCLRRVCDKHWEKMQPEDEDERKAAFAEALGWLLSKIFNRAVVIEQAQDPEWAFLVGEREQTAATVQALRELPDAWADKVAGAERSRGTVPRMLARLLIQLERALKAELPAPLSVGPTVTVGDELRRVVPEPDLPLVKKKVPKLTAEVLPLLEAELTPLAEQAKGEAVERAVLRARDLALDGRYRGAAAVAAKLWSGGSRAPCHDLRVLGYLAYAAYLQEGAAALPRILAVWKRSLGEGWESLAPEAGRERHLPAVLAWFLNSLLNHLAVSRREEGKAWRALSEKESLRDKVVAGLRALSAAWSAPPREPLPSPAPAQALEKLLELLSAGPEKKDGTVTDPAKSAESSEDKDEEGKEDEESKEEGEGEEEGEEEDEDEEESEEEKKESEKESESDDSDKSDEKESEEEKKESEKESESDDSDKAEKSDEKESEEEKKESEKESESDDSDKAEKSDEKDDSDGEDGEKESEGEDDSDDEEEDEAVEEKNDDTEDDGEEDGEKDKEDEDEKKDDDEDSDKDDDEDKDKEDEDEKKEDDEEDKEDDDDEKKEDDEEDKEDDDEKKDDDEDGEGGGKEDEDGGEGGQKGSGKRPSAEFMKQLDVGPLALLEERLRAFDTLIERDDHERAAVVADAIEELVAGFDGKALLSRVLARFYAQVCAKAGDLEEASEKRGTLRGRALRQLFRLDLAAFLKKED